MQLMPRQLRQQSGTGIYHVMLRGINQQNIFESREDYWKFIRLMRAQAFPEDNDGKPLPPHCIIYAYCLMSNHVHLLIRELDEGLTAPVKSIAISYAYKIRTDPIFLNGGVLTISGTTTMSGNGKIRVCEGGTLIVDGGTIQNANLTLVPGCSVILRNGGVINMATGNTFKAPVGAILNIESGEIY